MLESVQGRVIRMVNSLEVKPYEEALRDLNVFHMEKSEFIIDGLAKFLLHSFMPNKT